MSRAMYAYQRRLRTEAPTVTGYRPSYQHVLLLLASYADGKGVTSPGVEALSGASGLSVATVKRALGWATRHKLLTKVGGGYRGTASIYRLPKKGVTGDTQSSGKGVTPRTKKGVTGDPPPYRNSQAPRTEGDAEPWKHAKPAAHVPDEKEPW